LNCLFDMLDRDQSGSLEVSDIGCEEGQQEAQSLLDWRTATLERNAARRSSAESGHGRISPTSGAGGARKGSGSRKGRGRRGGVRIPSSPGPVRKAANKTHAPDQSIDTIRAQSDQESIHTPTTTGTC
jgi:hypothetical protein